MLPHTILDNGSLHLKKPLFLWQMSNLLWTPPPSCDKNSPTIFHPKNTFWGVKKKIHLGGLKVWPETVPPICHKKVVIFFKDSLTYLCLFAVIFSPVHINRTFILDRRHFVEYIITWIYFAIIYKMSWKHIPTWLYIYTYVCHQYSMNLVSAICKYLTNLDTYRNRSAKISIPYLE